MLKLLLIALALSSAQAEPIRLTLVTVPDDSRVDLPLTGGSQVELRREATLTRVRARIDRIETVSAIDPRMRAYVLWAVSPEGDFENLGELEVNGRRGELETVTALQTFGILVTAEPHFQVDAPSRFVAFQSGPPRGANVRSESFAVQVGVYDYSTVTLPPQGSLPSRVTQARMALGVAEAAGAADFAPTDLRSARVALDSMEELLRRNMSMEIVLPYINDSIRLAARAARISRTERLQTELRDIRRRAELGEQENQQMQREIERLNQRQADAENRLAELRAELQAERSANRTMELEIDSAISQLSTLENELARLNDPWFQTSNALIRRAGARETVRGLTLTIAGSYFERNGADLQPEGREFLSLLAGLLLVDAPLDIRIEGHSNDSGPASRSAALSEQRAEAVRSYLITHGVPEADLLAEGFGTTRPISPDDSAEARALNERVEIVVRGLR